MAGEEIDPNDGHAALMMLQQDLRYPMADVRQLLQNYGLETTWRAALVLGDPTSQDGEAILMFEDDLSPEGFINLVEQAMQGGGDGQG